MGHGFACLGESDGSWFQQGGGGPGFASGIPRNPCANTVLSAGPDWNYASLAEIARSLPCSGSALPLACVACISKPL